MMRKKYYLLLALLAIGGALAAVSLLGVMSAEINAFKFQAAIHIFDHGFTEIKLPPLGSIRAKTHETPLKISVTLTNIDLFRIKNLLENDAVNNDLEDITEQIRQEIDIVIKRYVVRLILLAAAGGGIGVALLRPRSRSAYVIGLILGALVMGGTLFQTYSTYDVNEFENPEFRGVLEVAPWMISFTQEALVKVDELGNRLQVVAANLFQVYQTLENLDLREELDANLQILHISDIHNNPVAFEFVKKVADSFGADYIINTGDETDFGTPLESIIFQQIAALNIPYIFLGGNHDSSETLAAISQIKNVILLDGNIIELNGITLLGFSDPMSKTEKIAALSPEEIRQNAAEINEIVAELQPGPDIVAVHNHHLAAQLAGVAPMIMHGHDHRVSIREIAGSIILDAGTSGASGIRGLQTVNEIPYSVLLLHFKIEDDGASLIAVDTFKVFNLRTGFTLERRILNKSLVKKKDK